MAVTIRRARPDDARALSELAARIYVDTFSEFDDPDDLRAFLTATYREDLQRAEIEDPAMITLLGEEDGLVAYAQIVRGDAPSCVTGPAPLQIKRFYVLRSHHGQGVARSLMDECQRAGRDLGARTIWLGVWEGNERAKAFYRKLGFREVGEKPFIVGSDVQRDLILERAL